MTIERPNMFEPMLEADPSFASTWRAFLSEWSDEPEPPLYIALDTLARHLGERLAAEDTKGLDKVFEVVERWHTDGDQYVREAATIGLLESLQNRASGFEQWLRPETRKWWDKLNRFWDGDALALREDS